jgi:anti-sigma regulatory factor (Ser/Thr protein kinase)
LALPATAAAPAAARALIARACQDWPARARNVAVLLTSELVTNAVLHGRPPLTLSLQRQHFSVRVAVADSSPVLPRIREPVATDATGRGLFLVASLAADWGIAPADDGGKAVWFLLQRPVG